MQTRFLLPLFVAAALSGVAMAQETTDAAAEPTAAEKATQEAERAAKAEARAQQNSWWHADGVAEALTLSEAQIQQMDDMRRANQEKDGADSKARHDLDEKLKAAFLEGDLKAAAAAADEIDQAKTAPGENAFKLEILSVLSKDQYAVLKEKYPKVLSEGWRRNTRRLVENKDRGERNRGERGKRKREKGAKTGEQGVESDTHEAEKKED